MNAVLQNLALNFVNGEVSSSVCVCGCDQLFLAASLQHGVSFVTRFAQGEENCFRQKMSVSAVSTLNGAAAEWNNKGQGSL